MNNRLKTLSRGIIDVSPLMIPVVPFGIIYGVIGMDLGIGPYMTLSLSIIIFGGASQIVLLQLFSPVTFAGIKIPLFKNFTISTEFGK